MSLHNATSVCSAHLEPHKVVVHERSDLPPLSARELLLHDDKEVVLRAQSLFEVVRRAVQHPVHGVDARQHLGVVNIREAERGTRQRVVALYPAEFRERRKHRDVE